jgi:hypothetical protein
MIIDEGDRVRHKNKSINGGLDMPVLQVSDAEALCSYLDAKDKTFKDGWFKLTDLDVVHKGEGGFKGPSER